MGGGTGTGAAPIVAEVARELGILTVAVVTKPFVFEGRRLKVAQQGLEELGRYVDSLIVIPNEKLMDVLGQDVSMLDAFKAANGVLHGAVAGIAEVIKCPGLVNVDFADVRTVMSEMGMAMMGSAVAAGAHRATEAAEQAVASPLLDDVNLAGARGVLVNITASLNLKMKEVHEVMNTIKAFTADDATVIVGTVIDENMGDSLRVTMVATGLGGLAARPQPKPQPNAEPDRVAQAPRLEVIRTGTDAMPLPVSGNDFSSLDMPTVIRARRPGATVDGLKQSGMDTLDIPAFLRKQAD
jgi:cell division protein FtsZ